MEVLSRGWRSDLALLQQSGSVVEHHPTHVVVRSPENPAFHWGNFLLLRRAPLRRDAPQVLELFARQLPDVEHVAIGVDDPEGTASDLQGLADLGMSVSVGAVLTADAVAPPSRRTSAEVRQLTSHADWEARLDLALGVAGDQALTYAAFAARRTSAQRRLSEQGVGVSFGAFIDGNLLACLGMVRSDTGTQRLQELDTRPEWRRRGLGTALVSAAGIHAFGALGASTLLVVSDPDYPGIGFYRRCGFVDAERQPQALQFPGT